MVKSYALDASALFGFLEKRPGGPRISELLKQAMQGRIQVLMSAMNYGEVYAEVLRLYGTDRANTTFSGVRALPIGVLDVTPLSAIQAAEVKIKYKLYYADSFAAALAIEHKATLVTSDSDFRKLRHRFPVLWLKP